MKVLNILVVKKRKRKKDVAISNPDPDVGGFYQSCDDENNQENACMKSVNPFF